MNPVFFGRSATRLYGIYHPAKGATVHDEGIVLCYPMGQEYMRAHRAFRMLSLMLAKRGYHVFRFDYFGTGDSAGESGAGSLEQWQKDLKSAIQELKETADVSRVSVVGLRLGGAIAFNGILERDDVHRLVMWDPVTQGSAFVEELLGAGGEDPERRRAELERHGSVGILGFPLKTEMVQELKQLDILEANIDAIPVEKIYLVVSHEQPSFQQFAEKLSKVHPASKYECIPADGRWNEVDNFGSALVPQEIIQGIVGWMSE